MIKAPIYIFLLLPLLAVPSCDGSPRRLDASADESLPKVESSRMSLDFARFAALAIIGSLARDEGGIDRVMEVARVGEPDAFRLIEIARAVLDDNQSLQSEGLDRLCERSSNVQDAVALGAALNALDATLVANQERLAKAAVQKLDEQQVAALDAMTLHSVDRYTHGRTDWKSWLIEREDRAPQYIEQMCGHLLAPMLE